MIEIKTCFVLLQPKEKTKSTHVYAYDTWEQARADAIAIAVESDQKINIRQILKPCRGGIEKNDVIRSIWNLKEEYATLVSKEIAQSHPQTDRRPIMAEEIKKYEQEKKEELGR